MTASVSGIEFLSPIEHIDWWGLKDVAITHCDFNLQTYDDDCYSYYGISQPAAISKAVAKRKAEFLAGRCCARAALAALNIDNISIPIGEKRNPVWPAGVKGAIAHCDDSAIAMATKKHQLQGVGVDIETIIKQQQIEETADYILMTDEVALLAGGKISEQEAFTIIFSIKESFFKAAFPLVKAYFDFDAVTVLELDDDNQQVSFMLNYALHPYLQKGDRFTTGYYHKLGACNTVASAVIL